MIDITALQLAYKIKNKESILESEVHDFTVLLKSYLYPIGGIPINLLENPLYQNSTFDENYQYLYANLNPILTNFYTSEELIVIYYYLAIYSLGPMHITDKLLSSIKEIIEMNFKTIEIEYFKDELKSIYIYALIEHHSDQIEEIQKLIAELKLVEEAHNNIRIDARK